MVLPRLKTVECEQRFVGALPDGVFDLAIDVGAGLGAYLWLLERKARKVLAFEPNEYHASVLEAGRSDRTVLKTCALGSVPGSAELLIPVLEGSANTRMGTINPANAAIASTSHLTQVVPVSTLDTELEQEGHSGRVDFVKIDVEGFELEVLRGGRKMLQQDHPLVLVEIELRHGAPVEATFDFLTGLGYRPYYTVDGLRFSSVTKSEVALLQQVDDLRSRTNKADASTARHYVNNFFFVHPESRLSQLTSTIMNRSSIR